MQRRIYFPFSNVWIFHKPGRFISVGVAGTAFRAGLNCRQVTKGYKVVNAACKDFPPKTSSFALPFGTDRQRIRLDWIFLLLHDFNCEWYVPTKNNNFTERSSGAVVSTLHHYHWWPIWFAGYSEHQCLYPNQSWATSSSQTRSDRDWHSIHLAAHWLRPAKYFFFKSSTHVSKILEVSSTKIIFKGNTLTSLFHIIRRPEARSRPRFWCHSQIGS